MQSSSHSSPFETFTPPQKQRNYSDIFDPKEYECKDSLELESYARNLHNYLMTLLPQTPFPAFLFEKLEKRLDGITSILQKRCAASGVLNKDQATKRLQSISDRLAATAPKPPLYQAEGTMVDKTSHPPKKRKLDFVKDIQKEAQSLRLLKASYNSEDTEEAEDEEEDSNTPQ